MAEEPVAKKRKVNVKRCFITTCPNSSLTDPNKIYFSVPKTAFRAQWIEAVKNGTGVKLVIKSTTSGYYCCEDHFNVSMHTVEILITNA